MDIDVALTKRAKICLGAAVVIVIAVAIVLLRKRHLEENAVTAVGLRGAARVTKDLSNYQQRKLDKYFLDTPPAAHSSGPSGVIGDVNAINNFNKRQTQ